MRINTRMGDLFRVSTEVFLITTIVGLAKSPDVGAEKAQPPAQSFTRSEQTHIPQPGSGGAAVIALNTTAENIEVDGRSVPLAEFLAGASRPDRVILRLKGAQWKHLSALVRTNDLPFAVETDP